jgi:hypothetical protein
VKPLDVEAKGYGKMFLEFILYSLILGFSILYIVPFLANSIFLPVAGKIPNAKFFNAIPSTPTYATYGLVWSFFSVLLWGAMFAAVIWLLSYIKPVGRVIEGG